MLALLFDNLNNISLLRTCVYNSAAGEDYNDISGTLTFSPTGSTVACRNFSDIIIQDNLVEGAEVFIIQLETNDTSVNLTRSTTQVTIGDDNDSKLNYLLATDLEGNLSILIMMESLLFLFIAAPT